MSARGTAAALTASSQEPLHVADDSGANQAGAAQKQSAVTVVVAVVLALVFSLIIYRLVKIDNTRPESELGARGITNKNSLSTHFPTPAPTSEKKATPSEVTTHRKTHKSGALGDSEGRVAPTKHKKKKDTEHNQTSTKPTHELSDDDAPPLQRSDKRDKVPGRQLICVVTDATVQEQQLPSEYCTHLVYSEVVFDPKHRKLQPLKNEKSYKVFTQSQRVAESQMSLILGLNVHQTVSVYLKGLKNEDIIWYFTQLVDHMQAQQFWDGIAILNVELGHDNREFLNTLKLLREVIQKKPIQEHKYLELIFGGTLRDTSESSHAIAQKLTTIANYTDIMVLETHYQRPLQLCKSVFPSAISTYGPYTASTPMHQALKWVKEMRRGSGRKARVCLSVSMVTLMFRVSGSSDHSQPGNTCWEEVWMNYAETCGGTGWSDRKTHPAALSAFRYKIKFWQAFEAPNTLAQKIAWTLDQDNGTCVAAYFLDYEDYYGICDGKFPRLKAIRTTLDAKTKIDKDLDILPHP